MQRTVQSSSVKIYPHSQKNVDTTDQRLIDMKLTKVDSFNVYYKILPHFTVT